MAGYVWQTRYRVRVVLAILIRLGFGHKTGADRGKRCTEILKQTQYAPLDVALMSASLFIADRGHLDDVEASKVVDFEKAFHRVLQQEHADLLKNINEHMKFLMMWRKVTKRLWLHSSNMVITVLSSGKQIRQQISSIRSTKKGTSAMQLVAASKMRKTQAQMQRSRPYADKIRQVIAHLAAVTRISSPLFDAKEKVNNIGLIVSTDRYAAD